MSVFLVSLGMIWHLASAIDSDHQCLYLYSFQSDDNYIVDLVTDEISLYQTPDPSGDSSERESGIHISPDGRYDLAPFVEGESALILVNRETKARMTLSENGSFPNWSQDATWLAYAERDTPNDPHPELVLYNVTTEERTRTEFEAPSGLWGLGLAWSPDSTKIALSVSPDSGATSIVSVFSALDLSLLDDFEVKGWLIKMDWSPSSKYLVVYSNEMDRFLIVDTAVSPMNVTTALIPKGTNYEFHWSPDSTFLAIYDVEYGDSNETLFIMEISSETVIPEQLVPNYEYGELQHDHIWLDDGKLLINVWKKGLHDLTLFDLETGKQQILQATMGAYAVSGDQRYLAVNRIDISTYNTGTEQIHIFDLTTLDIEQEQSLIVESRPALMTWHDDQRELVVLFENGKLRGYNYRGRTWHTIGTLPDDVTWRQFQGLCPD